MASRFGIIKCGEALSHLHLTMYTQEPCDSSQGLRLMDEDWQEDDFSNLLRVLYMSPKTVPHLTLEFRCFKGFFLQYDWRSVDELLADATPLSTST